MIGIMSEGGADEVRVYVASDNPASSLDLFNGDWILGSVTRNRYEKKRRTHVFG